MLDFRKPDYLLKREKSKAVLNFNKANFHRIGPIFYGSDIGVRALDLLLNIHQFFTVDFLAYVVVPVITQNSKISLRLVDWANINYCKKNITVVTTAHHGRVDVCKYYRRTLSKWHRCLFDTCRRQKGTIVFFMHQNNLYSTTVAQLHMLKILAEGNILKFIFNNKKAIELDMNNALGIINEEKEDFRKRGVKRKRRELSKESAVKTMAFVHTENSMGMLNLK
jgi:hypothetical protein